MAHIPFRRGYGGTLHPVASRMVCWAISMRQALAASCTVRRLFLVKRDGSILMSRCSTMAAESAGSASSHARIWASNGSSIPGLFGKGLVCRYGRRCVGRFSPACQAVFRFAVKPCRSRSTGSSGLAFRPRRSMWRGMSRPHCLLHCSPSYSRLPIGQGHLALPGGCLRPQLKPAIRVDF
jgi:hypothetical protein